MIKRLDVFLGSVCNNNCVFCCSKEDTKELSTKDVLKMLDKAKEEGINELHFTGSEPTIRKDFLEIVNYSKERGFEDIKITTNGRMLSYPEFCKQMIEAGVNRIIFSIHGHNKNLHDKLTRTKGSFDQLIKGIKNAKKYGAIIESNTTIVKDNYSHLKEIAELLIKLEFASSELIFVHPKGNAIKHYDGIVPRFSEVEAYLHDAISLGIENKRLILSRYVPFCYMQDFERFMSEVHEPLKVEQVGEGFYDDDARKTREEIAMKKSVVCKTCKFDPICLGVHKEHKMQDHDFKPIKGEKIFDREEILKND